MNEPPLCANVFVSHAEIARPLGEALQRKGLKIWYNDKKVFRLADRSWQSIHRELASYRFGVVILTAAFCKEWSEPRFTDLLARETKNGAKVFLLVSRQEGRNGTTVFPPLLVDKVVVSTEFGLERVAKQVLRVIKQILKTIELPE